MTGPAYPSGEPAETAAPADDSRAPPSMLLRLGLPLLVLAVCVGITALLVTSRPEPGNRDREPPALYVDVIEVQRSDVALIVKAQGNVSPRTETTLVSEVAGTVVERSEAFVAGGFFEAGEVLLQIDPRNYRAEVARAEAAIAQSRTQIARELVIAGLPAADLTRLIRLGMDDEEVRRLTLAKPQLAQALAEMEAARAQLEQAEGDLDRTRIRAPYEGMVRTPQADVGQYVNVGTSLATTFAIDIAEVRIPLNQSDLPFLTLPRQGLDTLDQPQVTLVAEIGSRSHQWRGRLVRTEGVFDPRSQVLYAVVQVIDPYGRHGAVGEPLRVGTFVRAEIEGLTLRGVMRLPRHTLRPGNRLWVVDAENTLQPRDVSVARADEDWIYVSDGLADGDRVSTTPINNPLPGMPVRIVRTRDNDGSDLAGPAASAAEDDTG